MSKNITFRSQSAKAKGSKGFKTKAAKSYSAKYSSAKESSAKESSAKDSSFKRTTEPVSTASTLKKGQRFTARVRDVSSEGNAVVEHPGGQVFFVPGLWFDELAEITITEFRGRFGFGRVRQLLEASADRVAPACKYHPESTETTDICGGCSWMFVDYSAQLKAKQARVEQQLSRLNLDCIQAVIPATQQLGYRNRAQFKSDGRALGYMSASSNDIVAIDDCLVLSQPNRDNLSALLDTLPNKAFQNKPRRGKKVLATVDIDETLTVGEASVNQRLPFRQPNSQQNQQMKDWLAGKLKKLGKNMPVLELFAGSGNFTEVIVDIGFEQVVAVEGVGDAVNQLAERQLPGVSAFACNLFVEQAFDLVFNYCRKVMAGQPEILVLDPPRDGLKNKQGLITKKSQIKEVFYISCDLATFSRDLQYFVDQGFTVVEVQPIDQLPQTPHIELLAHLSKAR